MENGPSVAFYVLDEESTGVRNLGGAARWWLHHALDDLGEQLAALGVPLLLFRGKAADIVHSLTEQLDVAQAHWNRRYSPAERHIDTEIKSALQAQGIEAHSHAASLLAEPWQISNGQGEPYKVFAAFHRQILDFPIRALSEVPAAQEPIVLGNLRSSLELSDLDLLPSNPDWSKKLHRHWSPEEASAHQRLDEVLEAIAGDYSHTRDRPDLDGTSCLSPALRWGQLSPVQVFRSLTGLLSGTEEHQGAAAMRRQLVWRDFCWHLIYHFPQMINNNYRPEFDAMDWTDPEENDVAAHFLECWQAGRTGYGMVDAGMRQLWETGWMHNRVRMLTASFLVKNLQIHWKAGEQWFWDTLVDADLACNTVNWQWVAGSGTDAAPYFRIFNPELQGKKFDPNGSYVSRYAPLGYPQIVDLKESREQALAAYERVKEASRKS